MQFALTACLGNPLQVSSTSNDLKAESLKSLWGQASQKLTQEYLCLFLKNNYII